MKSTDLRAKARAIFGSAIAEPMPNQPNGAKALQQRANARPIPTYKVGGVVKKQNGGAMSGRNTPEADDVLITTARGKRMLEEQKRREAEKAKAEAAKRARADKLLGIPAKKEGGKLSEFEKAFAGARKEGKKTFDYNGKSYTTEMRSEPKEAKKTGFGDAFASARRAGKETFEYNGKTYGTKMANEAVSDNTRRAVSKMPMAPAAGSRDNPFKAKSSEDITVTGVKRPTVKERFQSGKLFKAKDGGKACGAMKKGGKVQTSADTAKKLATEMGGMKKGGKAKDGLAVMIAIGKVKKPVKKAMGGTGRANMSSEPAAKNPRGLKLRVPVSISAPPMPTPPTPPTPMPTVRKVYKEGGAPVKKAVGGAGKTRKGMAPIKKAQGGAAKVRKGMMSETGDIKQVVKPKKGIGGM